MHVDQFFDIFLEELKHHDKLREYYKFHDDPAKLPFRKAYFCQRLQYVLDAVQGQQPPTPQARNLSTSQPLKRSNPQPPSLWDVGSGYSTTQIFLALNGIASRGSTLEFYYEHLPQRFAFWEKHGDMSLVTVDYENVFEAEVREHSTDLIIVQDTLHHLEPLQESLQIFHQSLRPGGFLLAIEENGNNLVQRLKLYRYRGNKRIIEYYDEGLGRKVLMGNENIRPLRKWRSEFEQAGFRWDEASVQYVRLLPPSFFAQKPAAEVVAREQRIWRRNAFLREYFFFGVNFKAYKPDLPTTS